MVTNPTFKLLANDNDITSSIKQNLISISFTDEANDQADELEIKVTGLVARPNYEDELKLFLGYGNELTFCGTFQVQTSTREDNFGLTISATGVNFGEVMKEKRNITYEKISMKAICSQIAKRNSLKVNCDFDDVYFSSQAQQNESDLHFLNRLSKELNAIFNIKNNTLIFLKKIKDDKKNDELPTYEIDINNCESISIKYSNKTSYKSCKAVWHDTKENKTMEILAGAGSPVYVYQGTFKDTAEAKVKAEAKLQIANQGLVSGTLTIPGEMIYAGGIINIVNSLEDDGEYQVKSVSHNFDSSTWKTSVTFER